MWAHLRPSSMACSNQIEPVVFARSMRDRSVDSRMVEEHGEGSWSSIAKSFSGRIGKQCRERWHNQLRPDIRRDAWTNEEEALLAEAHARLGNKWADISKVPLQHAALRCPCVCQIAGTASAQYVDAVLRELQSIPGRTENSVKNHWNATLRRRLLPDVRVPGETTCLRNYMRTLDLGDAASRRGSTCGRPGQSVACRTLQHAPVT